MEKFLLQTDFLSFSRQALKQAGTVLKNDPYIELYATRLVEFAEGRVRRLLINMPPRHAKSKLGSVCCAAWILAHDPTAQIMIITCSNPLADTLSHGTRSILESPWFQNAFSTRIAHGRAKSNDFETTDRGRVYATSFDGSLTGFGADVIIIDDPHDIADALKPEQIRRTVDKYDSIVVNRLNNPRTGRIMVVAHRIDENDLSAHLLRDGEEWAHLALPFIAPKDQTYDTAYGPWLRKKGDPLREDADLARVERSRKKRLHPSYELLYQQDVEGIAPGVLKKRHFLSFCDEDIQNLPRFISIDPGTDEGEGRSFSVIQLWASDGKRHYLLEQIRERCDFRRFLRLTKSLASRNVGAPILVERTANGPALLSALEPNQRKRAVPITPRDSKSQRLRRHYRKFLKKRIHVRKDAPFRAKFIREFVQFPRRGDDQVDATTQYLDYVRRRRDDIDFSKSNITKPGMIVVGYNSAPQANASLMKSDIPAAAASNSNYRAATRPSTASFDASSLNGPFRPQMPSIGLAPAWWERYRR